MKRSEIRLRRKTCILCKTRRARYRYRGRVRWTHQHCLCFACFRAQKDRMRATLAAAMAAITQNVAMCNAVSANGALVGLKVGTFPATGHTRATKSVFPNKTAIGNNSEFPISGGNDERERPKT